MRRTLDGQRAKGLLKLYLQKGNEDDDRSRKKSMSLVFEDDGNFYDGGYVAVISGGLADGGPTNRGQRDYARRISQAMLSRQENFPRVKISETDKQRLATPHEDPLITEFKVANLKVKRVLIDTRSSSDIINFQFL